MVWEEKQKQDSTMSYDETVYPSFNSVTEHGRVIMGSPRKKVKLNTLPRWLQIFYKSYYIWGLIVALVVIYFMFFKK